MQLWLQDFIWAQAKQCRSREMTSAAPIGLSEGVAKVAPKLRRRSPFLRNAFPYLLLTPALIYLLAITLYPGLFAIYQSLFVVKFLNWT
jgi:multiple sugar transport system permease protein